MQNRFNQLADRLQNELKSGEHFTLHLNGEDTDFVRFNRAKVRQPGSVQQESLHFRLIHGSRHASIQLPLTGDFDSDFSQVTSSLEKIRQQLPFLPEDPHLLINEEVKSTESIQTNQLGSAVDMVDNIIEAGEGLDMVGILASGSIYRGFANSHGQRNWFSTHNFNYDWSLVYNADKAVKSTYAGKSWDAAEFESKMDLARRKLKALNLPAKTLEPGEYRVYLSPEALWEILELLSWGGFSLRAQESKVSPLLKLVAGEESLHPSFSLWENVKDGSSPDFQEDGFTRPDKISLIQNGKFQNPLISPRSAKEYKKQTNGSSGSETPDSLEVAAGELDETKIIETLDNGVHVGNLWYLNYSDRSACRITGMTRFATFWIKDGEVAGPLNVMRFDDTLFRILGSNLLGLTKQRSFMLSASSYFHRSTNSARLPGALVKDFRFTL